MINIHAMAAVQVPAFVAEQCTRICETASDMQRFFDRIATGELFDGEENSLVAYAWIATNDEDGPDIVGWAVVSEWSAGLTLRLAIQVYVVPEHRSRGVATAMCACLTHDLPTHTSPVAVFCDEVMRIARRLHWHAEQYRRVDDGWIGIAVSEGRGGRGGSDEG